jgi:hypothetical protein
MTGVELANDLRIPLVFAALCKLAADLDRCASWPLIWTAYGLLNALLP